MKVVEALKIVGEIHLYVYEDDEGTSWMKPEGIMALQCVMDSGIVAYLRQYYRDMFRSFIDDGLIHPPENDPNYMPRTATH